MIAREPLKRDPNAGRKPERAVLRNLGAGCSRLPAIAILPPALERRMVGLRELVSGESRLDSMGLENSEGGPGMRLAKERRMDTTVSGKMATWAVYTQPRVDNPATVSEVKAFVVRAETRSGAIAFVDQQVPSHMVQGIVQLDAAQYTGVS